jgi:glycosyltransferase involved in cell wall biosynthesis
MKENKFISIPNGIFLDEVENYDTIPEEIKTLVPTDKFIIGYAGTIGIANALNYLFEAARLLKQDNHIHFVIVGRGGELKYFQQYCIDNNLSNVTFIPAIPKKQIQSILKLFDVCYLGWHNKDIYKYGISANKLFDYMYSSTPILHSISTKNDIVKEANCGISVKAEDSLAIKEAILYLYTLDKDSLDKMGQNAKAYVMKYHNYKTLSKQYMEII